MANQQAPRLLSYERRGEYVFNNSDSYHGNLSRSPYDSVQTSGEPRRSSSFQRRAVQDEFKYNRPRRISNTANPPRHELPPRYEVRSGQRMLVNGVVDPEFTSLEYQNHRNRNRQTPTVLRDAYQPPNGSRDNYQPPNVGRETYHAQRARAIEDSDNTYSENSHYYSIPNSEYYDNVESSPRHRPTTVHPERDYRETEILDDASDAMSEMYQSGRFGGEDEGSTSDEGDVDDPEFLEIQERENIIKKYSEGPDSKNIDDWENPDSDLFKKMDRFGFLHKTDAGLTDEERAHKLRIETEYRREKKWRTMLELWPKLRAGERPKKMEERVWKGIPAKWRLTVWPMLLDIERLKSVRENIYTDLLVRARLVSRDIKQIDLDINRTYRDHEAFRRRYDVKQQSLLNVLAAYAMYNTEVGYCQGMSQIAALFLMFLDEENTFWCLHSLMINPRHTMHGFFVPGFPKLTRFEEHFKKVLKKYRPRIYKHLEKQDIPYIYLTKWWFGCFLDRVPFSLALRLWDVFLIEGDCILIAMALNIMKMHEKRILKLQIDTFMEFIQQKIAEDFGFSENETLNSLRETLTKLKSDRLHIPPPAKDSDLSEVPTKALGPVLAKPLGTIRDEISEIQSRHSLAVSTGRSPYPGRKRSKQRSGSRTPHTQHTPQNSSASRLAQVASEEIRLPQGNSFRGLESLQNGERRDVPFEIPQRRASQRRKQENTPPPDPYQPQETASKMRNGTSVYDSDRALLQGTSSIRDERTGHNVTILRAAEDEDEDSQPTSPPGTNSQPKTTLHSSSSSTPIRVTHGSNNVTYISLGDNSAL